MRGHGDIVFHILEAEHMVAAAVVPAFDAELFCDNQQVIDTPIARIVAHSIEQFDPLIHGQIVPYPILCINPLKPPVSAKQYSLPKILRVLRYAP